MTSKESYWDKHAYKTLMSALAFTLFLIALFLKDFGLAGAFISVFIMGLLRELCIVSKEENDEE